MSDAQSLIALLIFVAVCLAVAVVVGLSHRKNRRSWVDKTEYPVRPEVVQRVKEQTLRAMRILPAVAPTPPKPKEHSARVKDLKQNLLTKVMHND